MVAALAVAALAVAALAVAALAVAPLAVAALAAGVWRKSPSSVVLAEPDCSYRRLPGCPWYSGSRRSGCESYQGLFPVAVIFEAVPRVGS